MIKSFYLALKVESNYQRFFDCISLVYNLPEVVPVIYCKFLRSRNFKKWSGAREMRLQVHLVSLVFPSYVPHLHLCHHNSKWPSDNQTWQKADELTSMLNDITVDSPTVSQGTGPGEVYLAREKPEE